MAAAGSEGSPSIQGPHPRARVWSIDVSGTRPVANGCARAASLAATVRQGKVAIGELVPQTPNSISSRAR